MSKEVLLVYQDCPYCKPREKWGKRQSEFAAKNGVKVIPTHFTAPGAKALIIKALSHGFESMPFFTDGKIFSMELKDFVKNPKKTQVEVPAVEETEPEAKPQKKATRKKATAEQEVEEEVDEVVPEAE